MTRKDYDAVAKILQLDLSRHEQVWFFANYMEEDNPQFDRDRFLMACGVPRESYDINSH